MTLARVLAKNFSYLVIARAIFRFLTAGILAYAARYLGVERFGALETATAWANVFLAVNDLGMSTLIVREGARDRDKMAVYFGNTLVVEIIMSLILYAVIIGIGLGVGYDQTTVTLIIILGAAGLIFEFRKVMRGVFRVLLQLKDVAILEVLNGIVYFFLVLWIITSVANVDLGLLGIAHARLWVNVLVVAALFIYTLRIVRPKFDLKQIWPMIKQSYVFTLYNMFFMLYFQIDQIIISLIKGSSEVGIYSAPAKLVGIFLFIPIMLFQVSMPVMYRYSANNLQKYRIANHLKWRYLVAIGLPAGVGLSVLATEIIQLVFGAEYAPSVVVLQVMGVFLAIRFFGIAQGNSLTTTDRQGLRALIQIISVGINIILDIFLITRYGAVGAAIATLITETIIVLCYLHFSWKGLQERWLTNLKMILPVVLSTAAMAIVATLAKGYLHGIVSMILGLVVYIVGLFVFRFFTPDDKALFQSLLKKRDKPAT